MEQECVKYVYHLNDNIKSDYPFEPPKHITLVQAHITLHLNENAYIFILL